MLPAATLRTSLLAALTALVAHAQPPYTPTFEVVSIRTGGTNVFQSTGRGGPANSPQRDLRYGPRSVTCNLPLQTIIRQTWYLKDFQIAGPDWLPEDLYDITAVMPNGTPKEIAILMIHTMLEQRFGLKYHMERREIQVYALVVAQAGFKLQPVTDPEAQKKKIVPTPMGNKQGVASVMGHGIYVAAATSIGEFAEQMSQYVDRPIVDLTKINALYEINLHWQPQEVGAPGQAVQTVHNDVEVPRVIERELGLKLEPRQLSFDVLVIDHIDKKPTDN